MDDYCYAKMATSAKRESERESAPPTKAADKDERVEVSNNVILEAILSLGKSVDEKCSDFFKQFNQITAMIVSLKKAVEFTSEEMKECKSQMKKVEEQNKRLCKENNDVKEEMLGKSKRCEEKTGPHVYINVQRIGDVQQMIGHPDELPPQSHGESSTLKKEASQPHHPKGEEEELWITQEGECLLGTQEADLTKLPLTVVSVKTEDDEEKPQVDNLLAPLSDREAGDEVEVTLSSDTDCEGDMRTHADNKHSESSEKKRGKKRLSCSVCGKKFARKSHLAEHMGTHTGEKTFSCQVCGKSFSLKTYLTRHMIMHAGENPFNCSVCSKPFFSRLGLTRHIMKHTGEKPFSCSVCGKRFSQRGHLTEHTRIHTGEKPYKCSICGRNFARRNGLTGHMRTHTGEKPFVCSVCGKGFSIKSCLIGHTKTHTREKTINC
ncbi:zinc finger protein 771-like isoform X3 [Entelurus aequoreus]|uniref:zinc finger protein 771-like isoform X3 n=1 Tax=Entelurus aequoreus TaxID=161455 RepID=UPI002B1E097C|nr:zinc finger protein 771-like isoform X3 [Entelurus aequoreus]